MQVTDRTFLGCSSSSTTGELLKALCKAQMGYIPIKKSGLMKTREGEYRYSTWADICQALYPSLNANGLVFMPLQSPWGDNWIMIGTLSHGPSGEWISSSCPIRDILLPNMGLRADSQSFEIATTYAKKTLLKAMAGGWEEGDEAPEQKAAEEVVERTKEQEELLAKARSQLSLVKGNKDKVRKVFARIDVAVSEQRLSQADADELKREYEEPKEEVVNAQ